MSHTIQVIVWNDRSSGCKERTKAMEHNTLSLERAQCVCRKSMEAYEREYEQLTKVWNVKMEQLEAKAIELCKSLHNHSEIYENNHLCQEE